MAISPKMLSVLQKVEAASLKHVEKIRKRGKLEAAEKACATLMESLKRKPPIKKEPIRASEKRKAS